VINPDLDQTKVSAMTQTSSQEQTTLAVE